MLTARPSLYNLDIFHPFFIDQENSAAQYNNSTQVYEGNIWRKGNPLWHGLNSCINKGLLFVVNMFKGSMVKLKGGFLQEPAVMNAL